VGGGVFFAGMTDLCSPSLEVCYLSTSSNECHNPSK